MRLPLMLLSLRLLAQAQGAEPKQPMAGSVVKSDEWIVRRSPEKEEEFIGNVSYRRGPAQVHADRALFRHLDRHWRLRGHVQAEHRFGNGDRVELRGDRADFSMESKTGDLNGENARPIGITHTSPDAIVHRGHAGTARWSSAAIRLERDVNLTGPRLDAWADNAELEAATRTLNLDGGRPVLYPRLGAWHGAVKADSITARHLLAPEGAAWVITANGAVTGWLQFQHGAGSGSTTRTP